MGNRILIAEDEPNIVESLTFLLERAGFEVSCEMNGLQALTAALANPPDVMILDVMLPGMDGLEVLRRLRADARTESLPVLILTAKGQREDRERALASGANMFITKPFSNSVVIAAVSALAKGEMISGERAKGESAKGEAE
ncbi:MAG: DNA-binding response OmpR family regulator [Gammaproteobacteria bacterium]|jgi:DNA-binding response OmpR family regulator